uniref:hypothetical protein n=1 Tax=Roseivirga sp. TaxID=1964215 RepID=UPI004048A401
MGFRITHVAPILKADFSPEFIKNQKEELSSKFKFKFRLLDGDRNIYFKGLATRNDSFDPLDLLGAEFGCTDLQYLEGRKYVSL